MNKQDFYACKSDGKYFDIGSQLGYLKANVEFALKRDDLKEDMKEYLEKF
jgi:UTP--glucose-1-phosphate uridylyltransferase